VSYIWANVFTDLTILYSGQQQNRKTTKIATATIAAAAAANIDSEKCSAKNCLRGLRSQIL